MTIKASIVLLLVLTSAGAFAQMEILDRENIPGIRCYTDSKENIKLYKSATGGVVDSLPSLADNEHCWYVIEISKSKNGRYKIDDIGIFPSCRDRSAQRYKGLWMDKDNDLFIDSSYVDSDTGNILVLYSEPSLKSEKILIKEYQDYNVLDFKNRWVRVEYTEGGILKSAWMHKADQCYRPWTVCSSEFPN